MDDVHIYICRPDGNVVHYHQEWTGWNMSIHDYSWIYSSKLRWPFYSGTRGLYNIIIAYLVQCHINFSPVYRESLWIF